jgi:hypothetical protein
VALSPFHRPARPRAASFFTTDRDCGSPAFAKGKGREARTREIKFGVTSLIGASVFYLRIFDNIFKVEDELYRSSAQT